MAVPPVKGQTASDAPLAAKAAKGDARAWAALVDRYSAYVYTLLRATSISEEDQADAFQYVFIELFKALNGLRSNHYLAPWIRQTTLRHAIRLRERAREPHGGSDVLDSVEGQDDLQRDLEAAEQAQMVREGVASLQDRCRELIRRLFFDDPPQSYAEVARSLGIKAASIGMTRQRCLEALEHALRSRGIA